MMSSRGLGWKGRSCSTKPIPTRRGAAAAAFAAAGGRRRRFASPGGDGLPETEPVSAVDLRQRGLWAAGPGHGLRPVGATAASGGGVASGGAVGCGPGGSGGRGGGGGG